MGSSTNSDVCKNVSYLGEFDLREIILSREYEIDEVEDKDRLHSSGWELKDVSVEAGLKNLLWSEYFIKQTEDKTYYINIVNTSEYASVGGKDFVVFSDDQDSVAEFIKDFQSEIPRTLSIEDVDAVCQTL